MLHVTLPVRPSSEHSHEDVTPVVDSSASCLNTTQLTIGQASDWETEGPFSWSSNEAETHCSRLSRASSLSEGSRTNREKCISLMKELTETELPVVICDTKRKLEVHITDPEAEKLRGSEVLKLSMKQYIERLHEKEKESKVAMKCLRDRVESLQKEVSDVAQSSHLIKDKAVREVRKFWRDSILEEGSRGGKMVKVALRNKKVLDVQ